MERPEPAIGQRWDWHGGHWDDFTLMSQYADGDWLGKTKRGTTGAFDRKMMAEATFIGWAPGYGPQPVPEKPVRGDDLEFVAIDEIAAFDEKAYEAVSKQLADANELASICKNAPVQSWHLRTQDQQQYDALRYAFHNTIVRPLTVDEMVVPKREPLPTCQYVRREARYKHWPSGRPAYTDYTCALQVAHAKSPYCERHIAEKMVEHDRRRNLLNGTWYTPPQPFQQSHLLGPGAVGIWSLREQK